MRLIVIVMTISRTNSYINALAMRTREKAARANNALELAVGFRKFTFFGDAFWAIADFAFF